MCSKNKLWNLSFFNHQHWFYNICLSTISVTHKNERLSTGFWKLNSYGTERTGFNATEIESCRYAEITYVITCAHCTDTIVIHRFCVINIPRKTRNPRTIQRNTSVRKWFTGTVWTWINIYVVLCSSESSLRVGNKSVNELIILAIIIIYT